MAENLMKKAIFKPGGLLEILADSNTLGLSGLLYKDYKRKKDEEEAKGMPAGAVPGMKKGGKVASASKRADGIVQRGKTKGRYI